jgi:hypothetical protein
MSDNLQENYCSHCGVSLIPLPVPHSSADCNDCGRRKHFVRLGEGGKGFMIVKGESFTIPNGWLTMSFDPLKSKGQLSRSGVPFLVQQLMMSGMPGRPEEFAAKMEHSQEAWEAELQASDKLAGIDLQGPDGGDKAWDRLKDDRGSWEWHLLSKCILATIAREAVDSNEAANAAHAALHVGLEQGMSIMSEPYFEEMLWRGYQAGLAIHEASTAADHVPGELEALAELDPLFQQVGEATLRTWLDSGSAIGPRIGVTRLPEPLLVARAKWHAEELKRQRDEKAKAPAERRAESELRLKWLQWLLPGLGGALIGSVATYLGLK